MVQLSQRLLCLGIDLIALRIGQVLRVFVCGRGGIVDARKLLPSRRGRSGEIALSYGLQVCVKLCYVCSLVVWSASPLKLQMSNVAYNAVCLLQKLVQILHAEDIRLDRLRIVLRQHLVEDWSDVHGVVLRLRSCGQDDDAPAVLA